MKNSIRFEAALHKLYIAFHNQALNPEDYKQCAVGNLLDGKTSWQYITDVHGSTSLNYIGLVNQHLGKRFNGYNPKELLYIERAFLKGCGYHFSANQRLKRPKIIDDNSLFNGLTAVVAELCKLDGVPNVMDCEKRFDFSYTASTKAEQVTTV
ncbi:Na(+)-translocating NADH-quinone reductase subunit F [Winogradskyella arenosi]|uniref:Uncharacterized protein n=1 Tax=Winogradskyella arenosi TaxID=533325 RepID=A0A368ZBG4_9FLAO|nr:Na(+)-translocating NADH-quinone reductase subunit F [Winogradskyella arenosi]RCW90208.1 hypothetical protein DFQ08_10597 [Winogradskyella arenosi]